MFELAISVCVLAVPVTFAEEATTFVVVMEFETYTLPWTLKAFAFGAVPIPMFDVTTSENVLATEEAFALATTTFVVTRALEATIFPVI